MAEEQQGSGLSVADAASAQDRAIHVLTALVEDLTVERDEEGLLESTLHHVVQALDLAGGVIFLAKEDQEPAAAAVFRLPEGLALTARELARQALERSETVVQGLSEQTWLAATPLSSSQHRLGALTLLNTDGREAPAASLLQIVGKQIGTGLENVRLYAELRAASLRTAILNRVTAAITSSMDLKTVVPAFARELRSLLSFDRLAFAFVNDSGDYIEVVAHPEGANWGIGTVIPVVGSGPGSVLLNNRAVVQRDLLHNHRFIEDMRLLDEGLRAYVLLPINSHGRAIGVLALGSSESEAYDQQTLAQTQPLADAVALALENVRLFQKTRELSITDEVTPLYNFRFFHQILDRELKLVDRYKSVLSLLFLDLDRFKPINDQYGHLRGSRVLREVGFLLRAAVRESDYPARYGGDEFCVIMPQTDAEAARALGQELRRIIEEHTFLQEEGIDARLGLSFGVATYPNEAATKEALIRLADERMYMEKEDRHASR